MQPITVHLRGPLAELEVLQAELRAQYPMAHVAATTPKPQACTPLRRQPHRQMELFDLVITITLNIGTSMAATSLHQKLMEYLHERAAKKGVEVTKVDSDSNS